MGKLLRFPWSKETKVVWVDPPCPPERSEEKVREETEQKIAELLAEGWDRESLVVIEWIDPATWERER